MLCITLMLGTLGCLPPALPVLPIPTFLGPIATAGCEPFGNLSLPFKRSAADFTPPGFVAASWSGF